jgi:hypothetical protein
VTRARDTLSALSAPGRRWAPRLAGLFVLWAVGHELATGAGFVAAVARPPGSVLLVLAGLAAIAAAVAEPFTGRGTVGGRLSRALALAGAGLLLLAPPLSLVTRETRMLRVGEGQELPPDPGTGLPALRVGRFTLAPRGPVLLSKTVEIPLLTADGEEVRVGLFPPARLAGWRLAVFQFGYAPAVEWYGADGRPIAEGFMMLGTFPRTEEEARLVEWLPQPNVMMGVGTFPPKVEDLLTPPGSRLHLHLRLQDATIAGARRKLADPEAYRYVMDGRPSDASLFVEVFEGTERRYAGTIASGSGAEFPGGRLFVAPELALWADIQAVRDPFVELFLAGGGALLASALMGLGAFAVVRVRHRR